MKKRKFSLRKLVYNDKLLIPFSLIIALIIWIGVSINSGATESRTIDVEVPISLQSEVTEKLGTQFYTTTEKVQLSISVTGAKYVVGQLDKDDFNISFDTSSVTSIGQQTLPIRVTASETSNLNFDISGYYPSTISAYYDINETANFPVDINYSDDVVADGYIMTDPVLSETEVMVSGPATYVNRISSVDANVSIPKDSIPLTKPYSSDCELKVSGTDVNESYLTIYSLNDNSKAISSINVNLPVMKVVSLPISTSFKNMPNALEDDALNVSYSTDSIKAGILKDANVEKANIGNVDFNTLLPGKNEVEFSLNDIEGITILDKNIKSVTATIYVNRKYDTENIRVSSDKVSIKGLNSAYKAKIQSLDFKNVTVVGPSNSVSNIDVSKLQIVCDLSSAKESGEYVVNVSIIGNTNCWIYGNYKAKVNIVKS